MDILESAQLPSLYDAFCKIASYNRHVVKELVWFERGSNHTFHPIQMKPSVGSFPLAYRATIHMPMYMSCEELDPNWKAFVTLRFTREFFANKDCNQVKFIVRFSRPPFHHHAWGSGNESGVCPGNVIETARRTKISDALLWMIALLNREKEVCMDGNAHNEEAYLHWVEMKYKPINHMTLYDANKSSLISSDKPKLIFKKV